MVPFYVVVFQPEMAFLDSFRDDPLIHTLQAPGCEDMEGRSRRRNFAGMRGTIFWI